MTPRIELHFLDEINHPYERIFMKKAFWKRQIQMSKILQATTPSCLHLIFISQFPIHPQLEKYFRSILINLYPSKHYNSKLEFFSLNNNLEPSLLDNVHTLPKRLMIDDRSRLRLKLRVNNLKSEKGGVATLCNHLLTRDILELSVSLKVGVRSLNVFDDSLFVQLQKTAKKFEINWLSFSHFIDARLMPFALKETHQYFRTTFETGITSTTKKRMKKKKKGKDYHSKMTQQSTIKRCFKLRSQSQDIKFIIKNLGEKENMNRNSMYINKYIKPNHAAKLLESNLLQFNKKKNHQVPMETVEFVSRNLYSGEQIILNQSDFDAFLCNMVEVIFFGFFVHFYYFFLGCKLLIPLGKNQNSQY